ncbi:uncharacterized protein LOC131689252 isoform X2 [Topomyia yanbarensis]|uniref:uncharacterized protein LOC131689252 isoform X2 n=1 Tax=Topomyia yanbarensis TaxID=2498891 RepID=UPI00273A8A46|nr:uncharacterized protein LOC131689252 isoform X2 [Topomyia yanbarensis]
MYAVVQFIEKQKLNVLTVPLTWVEGDMLMWPESTHDVIENIRVRGQPYGGPTRAIPMILEGQFNHFDEAERFAATIMAANDIKRVAVQDLRDELFENAVNCLNQSRSCQQISPLKLEIDEPTYSHIESSTLPNEHDSVILTHAVLKKELDSLRKDLTSIIQTTVQAAVESCLQTRTIPLAPELKRPAEIPKLVQDGKSTVENHKPINSEEQICRWNIELADDELCQQYLKYFAKIITPNSHLGKGDNACYTIVDCLFTREFWNQFTWTGINRGKKSKRGFREFGNVKQLLLNIIRIGDPSYNVHKLESFCKTRLFRHAKARALNPRLRKSVCRPGRSRGRTEHMSSDNDNVQDSGTDSDRGSANFKGQSSSRAS